MIKQSVIDDPQLQTKALFQTLRDATHQRFGQVADYATDPTQFDRGQLGTVDDRVVAESRIGRVLSCDVDQNMPWFATNKLCSLCNHGDDDASETIIITVALDDDSWPVLGTGPIRELKIGNRNFTASHFHKRRSNQEAFDAGG